MMAVHLSMEDCLGPRWYDVTTTTTTVVGHSFLLPPPGRLSSHVTFESFRSCLVLPSCDLLRFLTSSHSLSPFLHSRTWCPRFWPKACPTTPSSSRRPSPFSCVTNSVPFLHSRTRISNAYATLRYACPLFPALRTFCLPECLCSSTRPIIHFRMRFFESVDPRAFCSLAGLPLDDIRQCPL